MQMRLILGGAVALALQLPQQPRPVIRSNVTYVDTTVVVRDVRGRFVPDLTRGDFEIYEDGVRQELASFALTHGGRVRADSVATLPPQVEGLLLPPQRRPDASGRVFLIFIDDQHLDFRLTSRVRDLLKTVSTELIHDGDLFGVVSSGTSSIAVDMTYDRRQLTRAIGKVMGGGLSPTEILSASGGSQGPAEVRHRAHVAFSTAYDLLQKLGQVRDRRKAFIYISSGYDFDPLTKSRANAIAEQAVPDTNPFGKRGNEFAAADLAAELSELTREANRANTTIYTIDPRGLVAGGPDLDQRGVDTNDWLDHIRDTQSSLRVIADLTGGIAVVNQNDFTAAVKRIDADSSDNYIVGYYSNNADVSRKRRTIEIRVPAAERRRNERLQLTYKTSYTLKPPR
jgi:VWFA-related protein